MGESGKAYNFLVLNGPNLNLLGKRESSIYGDLDLSSMEEYTKLELSKLGISADLNWGQTNLEGEIVTLIQSAADKFDGVVLNPGGYSHTSVSILDAIRAVNIPVVEVHISKVSSREQYRSQLITAEAACTMIEGAGKNAYLLGTISLIYKLKSS